MVKIAVLSVLVGAAAAFAPSQQQTGSSAARLPLALESAKAGKEQVPCFGKMPWLTPDQPVFFGEHWWDKITLEWGTEDTGKFVQAAELKHGRSAMLATVGFAFHKFGLTLDNISPHEYLSTSQSVKFADLAAMTPLEALQHVPSEGIIQMLSAISLIELVEIFRTNGGLGLEAGSLTGAEFNPLQIKVTERRRLVELMNGRAAMFAISAWVAHDAVEGSVPLDLPWP